MSMSTHITAFRDMDGEFARMLEIKTFCDTHKVSYPSEVNAYFKGDADSSEDELRDEFLEIDLGDACSEWTSRSAQGYEVDVTKLPPEVKIIRFFNSW